MRWIMACGVLVLTACVRHPVDEFTGRSVPIRLSVKTNPPTSVTIVPAPGSGRAPLELGRTPIDEQAGAFVGDVIRLVNTEKGISYEERIEYGEPNERKLISKVFPK